MSRLLWNVVLSEKFIQNLFHENAKNRHSADGPTTKSATVLLKFLSENKNFTEQKTNM
jgi:hypothetical protein